jgi:hypothetical protein
VKTHCSVCLKAHKRLVAAQEKRIRNLQETNENIKKEFSSQLTTYTRLVQQANQRLGLNLNHQRICGVSVGMCERSVHFQNDFFKTTE